MTTSTRPHTSNAASPPRIASSSEILALVPSGDDDVFLLYEYQLTTGDRYRNAEYITVRDGRLVETQVFFGGRV